MHNIMYYVRNVHIHVIYLPNFFNASNKDTDNSSMLIISNVLKTSLAMTLKGSKK